LTRIILIRCIIIPITKKVKNKLVLILAATVFFATHLNGQSCKCDYFHKQVYSLYNGKTLHVRICAELLDSYKGDKVITEFFILDCRQDSTLDNQVHNEGQAFLMQPGKNGFSIILIDEPYDKTEPVPATFPSVTYYLVAGKLKIRSKAVPSKPVVEYLKKFKTYQKIK
jgi:hypothetical protein